MGLCLCEWASVFVCRSLKVARNDRIVDVYTKTLRPLLTLMSSRINAAKPSCSEKKQNSSLRFARWSREFSLGLFNAVAHLVTMQVLVICSPCRLRWKWARCIFYMALCLLVKISKWLCVSNMTSGFWHDMSLLHFREISRSTRYMLVRMDR